MRTFVAAALAALVLATHAHANSPREPSAAAFLGHVVRLLVANRYAEAWQTLHPIDKRVAPLQAYVECEAATPIVGRLVSLDVVRTHRELVSISPDQRRPSVAVTFRLALRTGSAPVSGTLILTAHAVPVRGSWAWILPLRRYEQYRSARCGE